MDKLSKDFAVHTIREIGLEVDSRYRIVNPDTGNPIFYKGKILKLNTKGVTPVARNEMEFNPLYNIDLMRTLFGYFADQLENEEDKHISYICFDYTSFSKGGVKNRNEGTIRCVINNNTIIKSHRYQNNDSVKYLDLITAINGNYKGEYDYNEFDISLTTEE